MMLFDSTLNREKKKIQKLKNKYSHRIFIKFAFLPCKMTNGCVIWLEPYFCISKIEETYTKVDLFSFIKSKPVYVKVFTNARISDFKSYVNHNEYTYLNYSFFYKVPFKNIMIKLKLIEENYEYTKNRNP